MSRGFNLIELIVVMIIIGILGSFAIPQFITTQERVLNNEAIANLRLIRAAERVFRMEDANSNYYASTGATAADHINNINTNLRLDIPSNVQRKWNYITTATGGTTCCTQATRNGADNRTYRFRIAGALVDPDPVAGGTCP